MDESTFSWINYEHQRLIHHAGYTDEMIGLASSFQRDLNVVFIIQISFSQVMQLDLSSLYTYP